MELNVEDKITKRTCKKSLTKKLDFIKIKKHKEVKIHTTEWNNMFAIHLSDKGVV